MSTRVAPVPEIVIPPPAAVRVSSFAARAVLMDVRSTVSTRVVPVPVIELPPPAAVRVVIPAEDSRDSRS